MCRAEKNERLNLGSKGAFFLSTPWTVSSGAALSHFPHALLKKLLLDTVHHFFSIICRTKMQSLRQHLRVSTPSIPVGRDGPGTRSSYCSTQQRRPQRGREVHFSRGATRLGEEGSLKNLDGDAAGGPVLRVCPASGSHRKLGSSAAAVGQQQQAPQTQPGERVAPQQRGRTSEHRLHAVPTQATLPRGLLVFETFDFLPEIGFTVSSRSMYGKLN